MQDKSGSNARAVPKKDITEYKEVSSRKVKHLFEESLFLSPDIIEELSLLFSGGCR